MVKAVTSLFHGTSGPRDASIAIVGESWGRGEEEHGRPFVEQTFSTGRNSSGLELTSMLTEAGIARNACFLTNVVPRRPPGNDMWQFFTPTKEAKQHGLPHVKGLYPEPFVLDSIDALREQLAIVQPEVVIGFGNYALWALTDNCFKVGNVKGRKAPTGITAWRGSQLHCSAGMGGYKFLPTYHPAAVMRKWDWRHEVVHDLRARVPQMLNPDWSPPEYRFHIRPNFGEVTDFLGRIVNHLISRGPVTIAADLETRAGHIACCGIGVSACEAMCIPFMCVEDDEGYWSTAEEFEIVRLLRAVFLHPNCRLLGQNFSYDLQFLASHWACLPPLSLDSMVTHHLLWPGTPRGLSYLSSLYCNYHRYWKDESKNWDPAMGEEQLWVYNCRDCVTLFEIADELRALVPAMGMEEQFVEQMAFVNELAVPMMLRGVRMDVKARAKQAFQLNDAIVERELWLDSIMPWAWRKGVAPWYRSTHQQQTLFYDTFGIKPIFDRKTGSRTMDDNALERVGKLEPLLRPIVRTIQELRSLAIFLTNFATAPIDPDHRMRCYFDPSGTETFRWSSSKNAWGRGANLQTIPVGTEDD